MRSARRDRNGGCGSPTGRRTEWVSGACGSTEKRRSLATPGIPDVCKRHRRQESSRSTLRRSDWSVLDPRSSRRLGAGGADTTCSALGTAGWAVVLRTCVYWGPRFCRRAVASAAKDMSAGWEASPCRSPARVRSRNLSNMSRVTQCALLHGKLMKVTELRIYEGLPR